MILYKTSRMWGCPRLYIFHSLEILFKMFHCELDGFRNIPLDGLHRKVSPGGPAVPHVRELDDLEAVPQHRLAQAARFHVDVVLGRGHEDLLALLLLRDNVKEFYIQGVPSARGL